MIRSLIVIFGLIAIAATAPFASAQDASLVEDSAASAASAQIEAELAASQPAPAGLPQAAPPPRTLRAYWHVFIAFALAWTLLFGYAISLGKRFGSLEREVRRLEGPAR